MRQVLCTQIAIDEQIMTQVSKLRCGLPKIVILKAAIRSQNPEKSSQSQTAFVTLSFTKFEIPTVHCLFVIKSVGESVQSVKECTTNHHLLDL